MGFLRKVVKKVKKRFKKLFSSKLGRFLGSIALGMILGPAIGKAFNGIKGFFSGAGAGAGTTAATTAGTTTAGTTTAATTGATTEAVTSTATEGIISDSVTGAMEKVVNNEALSNDLLLQAQKGLKGSAAEGLRIGKEGSKLIGDMSKKELAQLASEDLTVGQNIRKGIREVSLGARDFAADPFGKTKEYVGGDFIPDVARSVGEQYVMGALQGEPDVRTAGFGRMPQVGSMEASQNAYVAEVRNQIPNLPANINFQDMSNRYLSFGTLSPQFIRDTQAYLAATVPGR